MQIIDTYVSARTIENTRLQNSARARAKSGSKIQDTETHWKQWVSFYIEGSVETKWQQNK